jgi:hypothetical protein
MKTFAVILLSALLMMTNFAFAAETYVAKDEDSSGELLIISTGADTYAIEASVFNDSGSSCHFQGKCIFKDNILSCENNEFDEMLLLNLKKVQMKNGNYAYAVIDPDNKTCGMGVYWNDIQYKPK